MSFVKRIFAKNKKKAEPEKTNEPGGGRIKAGSDRSEDDRDEDPSDFLDTIGELALNTCANYQPANIKPYADLTDITIDDYPEAEIPENTLNKIEELKKIIQSIERKEPDKTEIKLSQNYKINYAVELNRAQLEAVTATSGPVLVIAGAGSGKTRVIVHRVAFMLENGIFPGEILLLTFTRKAANEMLGRVQGLLQESGAQKIFGGTFHAFSNYILRKYANLLNLPSNFTIIDTEDSADTIDLIKSELKLVTGEKAFPKKHRIQEIISSARNRNLSIRDVVENEFTGLKEYIDSIELIKQGYDKYKRICNIFDYDDLMEVLRDSLRDNTAFRKRLQSEYNYIMVDEYQDTNIVQKEIVEYLADAYRNILVVGDDAQSIYAFRGANYENILRFPQHYPDCRIIKIEENYRSNQKILDFTNEIIHNAKIGYKKKLYSRIVRNSLPVVRKFYDQQTEAEFVVSKILEYREKGIALNQVAVLVRAFWHARFIEVELNKRGIPYVAVGGLKFNERKHVKDVISYLRIVENPYDAVAWHRILKYLPGVGIVTARKIITTIHSAKDLNIDSFGKNKFVVGLKELFAMINSAGNPELSTTGKLEIIRDYYAPVLQATEYDYQIRLLDIGVLIDLAGKYDSISKFLSDFALEPPSKKFGDRNTPLIDETEDKPLTVSTIHSAKGLEWYSVIIPHALDGLLPSSRALKNIEEMEEERRLFYVACSRAKEDLIITMPSFVTAYNGFLSYPSRFLAEIGRDKFHFLSLK